jgi:hypothetical protein
MEEDKMKSGIGSKVAKWLVVASMSALPVQGFAGNVGTNDIIDSAITTPKIADGAVTAAKMGIVCPSGQYLQYNGSTWACSIGTAGPQGPQGVAGPQGLQGIKGDIGLTGPQGVAGVQGVKGDTGLQGPQGVKGDTGATGPQGLIGLTGPQGIDGLQGIQGVKGDKGDTGATGPQGLKGDTGAVGATGPQGPAGLDGASGPQGPVGATGPQGPAGMAAKYAQVIVVAKSGGDFDNPVDAMNSIGPYDAGREHPYLIKIMPGLYNITGKVLNMRLYVDIEGSGEGVTIIRSLGDGNIISTLNADTNAASIHGDFVEVRNITIEAYTWNPNSQVHAFRNLGGTVKLTHVTLLANYGKYSYGVYTTAGGSLAPGHVVMNDSTIISGCTTLPCTSGTNTEAYGVFAFSPVEINDSTIISRADINAFGILGGAGGTTIKGSNIQALKSLDYANWRTTAVMGFDALSNVRVINTQLTANGGSQHELISTNANSAKCIGVYDDNYAPVTCP